MSAPAAPGMSLLIVPAECGQILRPMSTRLSNYNPQPLPKPRAASPVASRDATRYAANIVWLGSSYFLTFLWARPRSGAMPAIFAGI